MKSRLASLFLLLILFGGAFAGVPISFAESQCSMGNMDMECCKMMLLLQSRAKFSHEEELLCVLNCAQNGTTLPAGVVRVTPPAHAIQFVPVMLTKRLPIPTSVFRVATHTHSPPGSPPTYLRNLALLI